MRRLDECKHRRNRWCFIRDGSERNPRPRLRIRIALVVAHQLFGKQREILDAAREKSDVIQRAREREHASARNQAVRRLEGVVAAKRARPNHRARGLAAERERHHVRGDRRGRAAGRAAGRVLRIMRIARLARIEVRALRRHGLAHDHCA